MLYILHVDIFSDFYIYFNIVCFCNIVVDIVLRKSFFIKFKAVILASFIYWKFSSIYYTSAISSNDLKILYTWRSFIYLTVILLLTHFHLIFYLIDIIDLIYLIDLIYSIYFIYTTYIATIYILLIISENKSSFEIFLTRFSVYILVVQKEI